MPHGSESEYFFLNLKIYLDHGEAYGNLGDEAMLLSALHRLSLRFANCRFVLPRENQRPLPQLGDFQVETVQSPFAFFCHASSLLDRITGAGSRLRRLPHPLSLRMKVRFAHALARLTESRLVGDPHGLLAFKKSLKTASAFYGVGAADFNDFNIFGVAYKCWLYGEVRRSGIPGAVSAQGFGPVDHPEMRDLVCRALDSLAFLSFRDHDFSRTYVESLGTHPCRTRVVCDEAFSLKPAPADSLASYRREIGLEGAENFLLVHWRATDYVTETHSLFPKVAALFDRAIELTGLRAVFVPMSYDVHSTHDDACCESVRKLMRNPDSLLMAPVTKDVALIKSLIGSSFCTLGLSYHVHVFGLSQGVPAINIFSGGYYRFKAEGLIAFFGAPNAAIDLGIPGCDERVEKALESIRGDRDAVSSRIVDRCHEIETVNDWTIDSLTALLEKDTL